MIQASEVDGVTILSLSGDFDSYSGSHVREMAAALVEGGHSCLVLDLTGVERIYTAGISALLDLQKSVATGGGRLICCGARPFIRELLRITMMDRSLELQVDLDSALDLSREAS